MENNSPILLIEINDFNYIFIAGRTNDLNNFTIINHKKVPLQGISNQRVCDLNLVSKIISENGNILFEKISK